VKSNDTIEREYRESQERSDERRRQKSPPRLVTVILSVMLSASLAVLFFMCLVALDVVRLKF
jgi:cell division septal protein FtsQ